MRANNFQHAQMDDMQDAMERALQPECRLTRRGGCVRQVTGTFAVLTVLYI